MDAMDAHVDDRAPASLRRIEPGRVGTGMRATVLDQDRVANGAGLDELQEAAVVRCKGLLLSVAKVPPRPIGGSDHGLCVGQRGREWLLTDHVPPCLER